MHSSALTYTVSVSDFLTDGAGRRSGAPALIENVSLAKPTKIVRRHARRGVKLFGGDTFRFDNWGARGGCGLKSYRAAFISVTSSEDRRRRAEAKRALARATPAHPTLAA